MADIRYRMWSFAIYSAYILLTESHTEDKMTTITKYRGFDIKEIKVTAGYESRVAVSRPVPFHVYRTYPDAETAMREIDKLLAGDFA